jgi:hypothetical protein
MKPCRYCAEEIQDAAIVCRFCNRAQTPPPREPAENWVMNAFVALVVVLVTGAGGFTLGKSVLQADAATVGAATSSLVAGGAKAEEKEEAPTRRPLPPPPPPPSRFTLMDFRSEDVGAGQYLVYAFDLRNWGPCSVRGHVAGTAGGGRDVDVFFVGEEGLSGFKAGGEFKYYFARQRTTDENLDLRVGPGRYYLIVSNRFSWMTGKTVMLDGVSAECVAPADAGLVTMDTNSVGGL